MKKKQSIKNHLEFLLNDKTTDGWMINKQITPTLLMSFNDIKTRDHFYIENFEWNQRGIAIIGAEFQGDQVINCKITKKLDNKICLTNNSKSLMPAGAFGSFIENFNCCISMYQEKNSLIHKPHLLLIPCFINTNHFTTAIIDFKERTIEYFDPFGSTSITVEDFAKKLGFKYISTNVRVQNNSKDCGPYSIHYAEIVARTKLGLPLPEETPYKNAQEMIDKGIEIRKRHISLFTEDQTFDIISSLDTKYIQLNAMNIIGAKDGEDLVSVKGIGGARNYYSLVTKDSLNAPKSEASEVNPDNVMYFLFNAETHISSQHSENKTCYYDIENKTFLSNINLDAEEDKKIYIKSAQKHKDSEGRFIYTKTINYTKEDDLANQINSILSDFKDKDYNISIPIYNETTKETHGIIIDSKSKKLNFINSSSDQDIEPIKALAGNLGLTYVKPKISIKDKSKSGILIPRILYHSGYDEDLLDPTNPNTLNDFANAELVQFEQCLNIAFVNPKFDNFKSHNLMDTISKDIQRFTETKSPIIDQKPMVNDTQPTSLDIPPKHPIHSHLITKKNMINDVNIKDNGPEENTTKAPESSLDSLKKEVITNKTIENPKEQQLKKTKSSMKFKLIAISVAILFIAILIYKYKTRPKKFTSMVSKSLASIISLQRI